MAGKSSQGNNRGTDLFGYFVSGKHLDYHTSKGATFSPDAGGLTASGGAISDYTSGSDVYRAHVFTASGTFEVTEIGSFGNEIEYLVVGGGGGGGAGQSGGGGAGGVRTNLSGHPRAGASYTVSGDGANRGVYTVTVGGGGSGSGPVMGGLAQDGSDSEFYPPAHNTYPAVEFVRGAGGGAGAGYAEPRENGNPGGSGGGACCTPAAKTGGATIADPNHPVAQGFAGGDVPTYAANYCGAGGGGAGGLGTNGPGVGHGGIGLQVVIAGPPTYDGIGAPGPGGGFQWFGGGGGGGGNHSYPSPDANGGGPGGPFAGGGNGSGERIGSINGRAEAGLNVTGGGGGGGEYGSGNGANGGSGVVVIRYQIGTATNSAQATGGVISYYGGKTIHTFRNSGTFANTGSISGVQYVILGGGGGGNSSIGGGGGAGSILYNDPSTTIPLASGTYPVVIGAGGGAADPSGYVRGGNSTWNGFTAGGGGCGRRNSTNVATQAFASTAPAGTGRGGGGGGGSGNGNEDGANGGELNSSPSGYSGGQGSDPSLTSGGGGGLGGGGGQAGSLPTATGGLGVQLPAVFQNPLDPTGFVGPGPSNFWVGGGGGGGARGNGGGQSGNGGYGGGAPGLAVNSTEQAGLGYAGAGNGTGNGLHGKRAADGANNSGSGGGGGRDSGPSNSPGNGGSGGSGLVLIAYPT